MSEPTEQTHRSVNWTAVAGIAFTSLLNIAAGAYFAGGINANVKNAIDRLDRREVKDETQDLRLNGLDNRMYGLERDVDALKEGRYNNTIQRLPNTPRIP